MISTKILVKQFDLSPQDVAHLHELSISSTARKYAALQALTKFGVSTLGVVNATDLELTEKVIRGWAHLLSDRDNAPVLSEARKELDGLVSNQDDLSPIKVHRQPASKGTPPLLAASAPEVPSPLELPPPVLAPSPLELPPVALSLTEPSNTSRAGDHVRFSPHSPTRHNRQLLPPF